MSQEIRLLHHGLDAIIQRDPARMPNAITPTARMQRYLTAAQAFPDHRNGHLRAEIGKNLQAAWRARRRPSLVFLGAAMQRIRRAMSS